MASILDTPAQAVGGEHGTTDTSILIRFPNGKVVPAGVEIGRTASEYVGVYNSLDGYTVIGVRQGRKVIDLPG